MLWFSCLEFETGFDTYFVVGTGESLPDQPLRQAMEINESKAAPGSRKSVLSKTMVAALRTIRSLACTFAVLASLIHTAPGQESQRKGLLLENPAARLVLDLGGGSLGEFRFRPNEINPLSWASPAPGDSVI